MTKDEARERRLAEALRANLKRRKAQTRGMADTDGEKTAPNADDAASPAQP